MVKFVAPVPTGATYLEGQFGSNFIQGATPGQHSTLLYKVFLYLFKMVTVLLLIAIHLL